MNPHENLLRGLPEKGLPPERENELSKKIQVAKKRGSEDEDSINELALSAMREAFFYGLVCAKGLPPGDVYSLCYTALRAAAGNFQPRIIRFFAYAKPYVRGEICRAYEALKVVHKGEHESLAPDMISDGETESEDHLLSLNPSDAYERAKTFYKADIVEADLNSIMLKDDFKLLRPVIATKLSEKERLVLQLVYEGGFNFRQIGSLLRVSRSDTQATLHRALVKLRCGMRQKKALFIK